MCSILYASGIGYYIHTCFSVTYFILVYWVINEVYILILRFGAKIYCMPFVFVWALPRPIQLFVIKMLQKYHYYTHIFVSTPEYYSIKLLSISNIRFTTYRNMNSYNICASHTCYTKTLYFI